MILSTKQFLVVSILIPFCCLLFAFPELGKAYRESNPNPKSVSPLVVPLPYGADLVDWGENSLGVTWKLVLAKGNATTRPSRTGETDQVDTLFVAGIANNKSDTPLAISSLTLLLQLEGVEVFSMPMDISPLPLVIPPKSKVTIQGHRTIPYSIVFGLLDEEFSISASASFKQTPNEG